MDIRIFSENLTNKHYDRNCHHKEACVSYDIIFGGILGQGIVRILHAIKTDLPSIICKSVDVPGYKHV